MAGWINSGWIDSGVASGRRRRRSGDRTRRRLVLQQVIYRARNGGELRRPHVHEAPMDSMILDDQNRAVHHRVQRQPGRHRSWLKVKQRNSGVTLVCHLLDVADEFGPAHKGDASFQLFTSRLVAGHERIDVRSQPGRMLQFRFHEGGDYRSGAPVSRVAVCFPAIGPRNIHHGARPDPPSYRGA